jgi:hypothetical protein
MLGRMQQVLALLADVHELARSGQTQLGAWELVQSENDVCFALLMDPAASVLLSHRPQISDSPAMLG